MSKGFGDILTTIGDAVAVATGNPELLPVINGGSQLVQGRGIGNALTSAGTAYLGNELSSTLGNQFPETFGGTFGTGGNSLTDLFGSTEGAGSFFGPGTLGGDLTGNFSPGSGLDSLFGSGTSNNSLSNLFSPSSGSGGSSQFSSDSGAGGSPTSDLFTNSARDATSGAAATGSSGLPGASAGSGISNVGGGSAGGFVNAPDINLGSFDNSFSGAAPAAGDIGSQFTQGLTQGGSKVASGNNNQMIGGLLKSILGGATNNTNQAGYQGENAAAQQAAQAYQPFLQNGTAANKTLSDLYGNNGQDAATAAQAGFANTPGYQFARNQGINALDASAAARGNLLSGNQIKAVQDYGTGLENQTYQQYVQNLQNQAGVGANAAGGYGGALVGGANALAQGGQAKSNNQNQMFGGALNALFPSNDILSLLRGNGGNNGILSALFGG